jgi:hypothetical protein
MGRLLDAAQPCLLRVRRKACYFHHDRFRGYFAVYWRSGLQPPGLRFAMAVTRHHARLGTRLRARLCRGLHLRRLNSLSFQGTTLAEPAERISRNGLPRFRSLDGSQQAISKKANVSANLLRPYRLGGNLNSSTVGRILREHRERERAKIDEAQQNPRPAFHCDPPISEFPTMQAIAQSSPASINTCGRSRPAAEVRRVGSDPVR